MEIRYIHTTKDLLAYINKRTDISDLSSSYLLYKLDMLNSSPYTVETINMRNEMEKELEFRNIVKLINVK